VPNERTRAVPERISVKNRLHPDLHVGVEALEAEAAPPGRLGAAVIWGWTTAAPHVNIVDAGGNEFDVQ
jgi:hypothetical protein